MPEPAIAASGLTKAYGPVQALTGLDLEVRPGEVFGFLGPNGAGKTTTIRLCLDLIRPSGGRLRVLGLDPRARGVEIRRRIGYLAADFLVDGRQTGGELLTYLANLRGGVPRARVEALCERLELDPSRRIRALSRGNRQKVGLVQAFMHAPELLVLDEPTSGLDPVLQREFAALVGETRAGGGTVFMSSHVMSEVQRSADRVGIIRKGRLVAIEDVDALRERTVRQVEVRFSEPVPAAELTGVPGVSELQVEGALVHCRLQGPADGLVKAIARHTVVSVTMVEPDLEAVFFAADAGEDVSGHAA